VKLEDVEEALSHAAHAENIAVATPARRTSGAWADEAAKLGIIVIVPKQPGRIHQAPNSPFPAPWEHDQVQRCGVVPAIPRITVLEISTKGMVLVGGHPRIKGGAPIMLVPSEADITRTAGRPDAAEHEIEGALIHLPPPVRDKGALPYHHLCVNSD
jgi:hypothetical protein